MKKYMDYILHPIKIINRLVGKNIIKMSDKTYLKLLYRERMGKKLNLNNPQTFNEKLNWLKLNDRKAIYTIMVDKYEAKKYVADLIGEEYIIPTIGKWDKFDEIDFDKLPEQFVLKCTHDSGGLSICKSKESFNKEEAKNKINKSLKKNYYYASREWPYKNVKPRIIAEPYLENQKGKGLIDYKFFCFNGIPKFLYISEGLENHETASISFLDVDFKKASFKRKDYKEYEKIPKEPVNFEKMKELSKILSKGITFLRVDFYEIEGRIYFSELTFYPCSGFIPFEPEKYDKIIGDMLILPKIGKGERKT